MILRHRGKEEPLAGVYDRDLADEMLAEIRERKGSVFAFLNRIGYDICESTAPEESRIMYARMRHPDEEMSRHWSAEASFLAVNLDDIIAGHGSQRVFSKKDLKKIDILDKDEAVDALTSKKKKVKKK